ncbi:MAG: RsmE family RNA methyltransferase [Peptoniphilaceae bacterium]|uniref:RsmE family RNA methyltransferase n=1 Tax=Parvimonas sp. TaxID=1944660 RepID=UPI0025F46850|nr:RsmE family RNA methyltransferase [Parvimonas sp.]MCI5997249.1 16S rRNA (uracil(1498)-N(3))-methyltransferase [Parvimonas sp.]MDD7764355.1 RsmE family RNA methyltransferase [Peptoniphilaceae bacterium]MDY3050059.1 RsmE family RNA methyltransferase [Parvimonas sp.]
MHRFFANETIVDRSVKLYGDDYNHINKVLRISENEKVEVVVDRKLYIGNIKIYKDYILVFNLESVADNTESDIRIHLLQCLVKGEKMDFIIQKAVELGVYDITLIDSKRCVVKFDSKKGNKKIDRFQKISYESAKQSKRLIIPKVKDVIPLKNIMEYVSDNLLLVAYEEDKRVSLRESILNFKNTDKKDIYILIGSEGGFEREEIEWLVERGAVSVGLGPRILRAETAGINLISILQYEFM